MRGNTSQHILNILKMLLTILSDDPRIRILMVLAELSADDISVSFRTIARRTGINYTKLRFFLSQLERAGFIESIKIKISAANNSGNNNRGYTFYRINQEIMDIIKHALDSGKKHARYLYSVFLPIAVIIYIILKIVL